MAKLVFQRARMDGTTRFGLRPRMRFTMAGKIGIEGDGGQSRFSKLLSNVVVLLKRVPQRLKELHC